MIRCALGPTLTSRALLDDARAQTDAQAVGRSRAALAERARPSLDPDCTRQHGSMGAPQALASVHVNEVRRLHAELLAGRRISVLAVTDAETERVTRASSHGGSHNWGPAKPAARLAIAAPESMRGEMTETGSLRAVIRFARQRTRRRSTGRSCVRRCAGGDVGQAWPTRDRAWGESASELALSGVAVAPREETLTTLDRSVREALNELQQLSGRD